MTDLQENLKTELQQALLDKGFVLKKAVNCDTIFYYSKPNGDFEESQKPNKFIPGTHYSLNGHCIGLSETYRCNGTAENRSYYLYVMKWDDSTGQTLFKAKISQKDGFRKRLIAIDKVIEAYEKEVK